MSKRDKYDRMFFGFRDQLTPRYGYEEAKRLAYQFIKRLRKKGINCDYVENLRCCDMADEKDRIKYDKLRTSGWHKYNGMFQLDDYVEVLGRKFRIGFDYGYYD